MRPSPPARLKAATPTPKVRAVDVDARTGVRTPGGWSPESRRALARVVFPARHAAIVAVAALVPFVPAVRDDRWVLVALCLVVLLPLDLAFAAWTRRNGRFPPVMPLVNPAIAIAAVATTPETLPGVAVLLAGDNALTAFVFGRQFSLVVTTTSGVLLSLVAAAAGASDVGVVAVGVIVSAVAMAWIIGNASEWERAAGARYAALVGEVDVIVWERLPGSDAFTYVSPAARSILGHPIDDWYEPGFWTSHVHPDDRERVLADYAAAVGAASDDTFEYRMLDARGEPVHLRDVVSMEVDGAGRVILMRGVMVDISDRRRAEDRLRQQATHDPLTGLPNRALLAAQLAQALREARRTGDCVALLLVDLDDFKEVNDALGHDAGDRLLAAFAGRLRTEVRECDTIARLGGDEFALLLTTDADVRGASAVAERVLAVAERPFDVDGLHLRTRASVGVAVYPDHATDAASLSARADVAMYLAKRSGQGSAVYEPELDRSSVRRLSLLGHLREAIASDALEIGLQPCFDLATGRVVSVEALVRWHHPEHGEVGPEEFIRLAEMSGLIQPLTRWVIHRAVDLVTSQAGPEPLQVSANLSVRNLSEPDLVEWLADLVGSSGLAPGRLVLELTETEVMTDIAAASAVLADIAGLGIELAIDDFGTGRSALAYLRRLPVQELKLDRSLVEDVGSVADAEAICAAIVGLAHRLGLRVVAEGVRGDHDVTALRRLGCDRVQGDALAPPVIATGAADLAALGRLSLAGTGAFVADTAPR
jgi:diguanylate cyclase (GGDEF)-like protein/PAS domain S-box-containing protein